MGDVTEWVYAPTRVRRRQVSNKVGRTYGKYTINRSLMAGICGAVVADLSLSWGSKNSLVMT